MNSGHLGQINLVVLSPASRPPSAESRNCGCDRIAIKLIVVLDVEIVSLGGAKSSRERRRCGDGMVAVLRCPIQAAFIGHLFFI
jgi:hypothetical protein